MANSLSDEPHRVQLAMSAYWAYLWHPAHPSRESEAIEDRNLGITEQSCASVRLIRGWHLDWSGAGIEAGHLTEDCCVVLARDGKVLI